MQTKDLQLKRLLHNILLVLLLSVVGMTKLQAQNITFADANVKAICVANWDTDSDGELSYEEAAAVTSLIYVFRFNSSITSFTELQYFIGLTSIGYMEFTSCSNLTTVDIPNSVTSIGDNAFSSCASLVSIDIPNSVTSIGDYAFTNCTSLTSIEIPNSVTSIGYYVFGYCSSLATIDIPNSVTSIGDYAFTNCTSLTSIEISNSVTSIGSSVFSYCSSLTSVDIPNSVTLIGNWAFASCSGLTMVDIPNSVTLIGNYAFTDCTSLASLAIPNSVTSIGNGAFTNCTGLTTVDISNSVTSIGDGAFTNCTSLTSIEIPNSVTSIGWSTFEYCTSLITIGIPNSVISIGNYAFCDCRRLTMVEIPNSMTSIGWSAFMNRFHLTTIEIPNSVTSIDNYAFFGCSGLTSMIVLADNPPILGDNVFYNVNKSIPVYVPYGTMTAYQAASGWSEFTNYQEIAYKFIPAYNESNNHWQFIASPLVDSITPITVDNMITETAYDLYQFTPSDTLGEWQNYKANNFTLANGQGYLYANTENVNLVFKGTFNEDETKEVSLDYDAGKPFAGWNLVGNPFPCNAYINREYYVMNEEGTGINPVAMPASTSIPPCTAVFVKAVAEGETVVFTRAVP